MYIYVFISAFVCIHMCTCVYLSVCAFVCVSVYAFVCMSMGMCLCVCPCVCVSMYKCIRGTSGVFRLLVQCSFCKHAFLDFSHTGLSSVEVLCLWVDSLES